MTMRLGILMTFFLSACTAPMTMNRAEEVAAKSYRLGCLDNSKGSPAASYECLKAAEKFRNELRQEWQRNPQSFGEVDIIEAKK